MSTSKTQYKEVQESPTEESILTRWSRRKQLAARSKIEEPNLDGEQPITSEVTIPEVIEHKTDADMPPIESINEQSNLSDFFSPKVSEALRKQAFRKLFHLPAYNITDGLNDYDEDYTQFTSLGDIVTAEMRHQIKQEAIRALGVSDSEDESTQEKAATQTENAPGMQTKDPESPGKDKIA